ncbi:MAG: cupin domain-containing protein, partial [Lysobacteraceae bacterium]
NPPLGFRDDVELKLLRQFTATHDWVLGPGDMLYLPPGVPHNGVAVDPCLTFSVGMRAPSAAELLGDFVDTLAADAPDDLRFRDPDLTPARDANEIDATAMARVVEALNLLRMNDADQLGDWFGSFITTYRSAVEPTAEDAARPRIEIEWDLAHGASLQRHPWSRMAWRKAGGSKASARLYAGGRVLALPTRDAQRLAAAEVVDGPLYDALGQEGRDAVFDLLDAGHYRLSLADEATANEDE